MDLCTSERECMDVRLTSVRFICNMLPAAVLEHLPLGLLYVACGVVLVHAPPCMAAYILPHAGDQVAIKALHALNQCPVYDVVVLSCAGLHGCMVALLEPFGDVQCMTGVLPAI